MRRKHSDDVEPLYCSEFETAFGWCCGIFNREKELLEFRLPSRKTKDARIVKSLESLSYKKFEDKVKRYFEGKEVCFNDIRIKLPSISPFRENIYRELRKTKRGEILTYAELALRSGNRSAARAVGSAMAQNRLPLIIPCHRVVRSDGSIGEFTSEMGPALKRKMLELEGADLTGIS